MQGSPAAPGSLMKSKPTWFSTLWVFNRVGFFMALLTLSVALRRIAMTITFATTDNDVEETTVYVKPSDTELAQQNRDFVQQRSDLLKFLTVSQQPERASP